MTGIVVALASLSASADVRATVRALGNLATSYLDMQPDSAHCSINWAAFKQDLIQKGVSKLTSIGHLRGSDDHTSPCRCVPR